MIYTYVNLHFSQQKNQKCILILISFQNFLIEQLPRSIFELLAEDRNNDFCSQLLWSKDPRIKLSVFLHPIITKFNVDAKGNELMQSQDDGLDEFFWVNHLAKLTNLVHLNLVKFYFKDKFTIVLRYYCSDINQNKEMFFYTCQKCQKSNVTFMVLTSYTCEIISNNFKSLQ